MAQDFDPYHRWLGIPPSEQPANPYRLLGLEQGPIELEVLHKAAADRIELVRRYANSPQAEVSEAAVRIQGELTRALVELEKLAMPAAKPAAADEQSTANAPPDAKGASGRASSGLPRRGSDEAGSPRPVDAATLRPAPLPDVPRVEPRPARPSGATPTAREIAKPKADSSPGKYVFGRILVFVAILGVAVLLIATVVFMNARHQAALAKIDAAAHARQAEIAKQEAERKAAEEEAARKRAAELAAQQEAERKRTEEEAARKAAELAAAQEEARTRAEEAARKVAELAAAQEAARKKAEQEAAESRPAKEIAVDLGNGVMLELVLIPAGSFMMGDDNGGYGEKPAHRVNITKPFYLGKYEVTQQQWQVVMGNNPSRHKGQNNPVENVHWDNCQTFLGKLNAKPGLQGGKFFLPTEAQWEYACRAGNTTHYCFGDAESQLDEYAWYYNNWWTKTHAVGEKRPNAWGLYDMHGNVCEWCGDWYDSSYYAASPKDDPLGPSGGSRRVFRGGSWDGNAWYCRSAVRYGIRPDRRYGNLGFRVALAVTGGTGLSAGELAADGKRTAVGVQTAELAPEPASMPSQRLGLLVSDKQVLLQKNPRDGVWMRLPAQSGLNSGVPILSLPSYQPDLGLNVGIAIKMLGGTELTLLPSDAQEPPGIEIAYGRLTVRAVGEAKGALRIRIGERVGTIRFRDANSTMAAEVSRSRNAGADPEAAPGPIRGKLYAAAGEFQWIEARGHDSISVTSPDMLSLDNQPLRRTIAATDLPKWIVNDDASYLDRRAAPTLEASLQSNRPVILGLHELVDHCQREVGWLAVRCLGYLGEFEPMVAALNNAEARSLWDAYIRHLATAIDQGASVATAVRKALEKQYRQDAPALYRMLWGYSDKQIEAGKGEELVSYLDNETLACRVLAFYNLEKLSGGVEFSYRPYDPAGKRQAAITRWKERLQTGLLPRVSDSGEKK